MKKFIISILALSLVVFAGSHLVVADGSNNPITQDATDPSSSDATLNATNGDTDATGHSFWVSLNPAFTITGTDPSADDAYTTVDLGAVTAGSNFSASLSSVTGLPSITPSTTYYYVAWSLIDGNWIHGEILPVTTAAIVVPPTTGTIEITQYMCPNGTTVVRSANGVGGTVPEGCVLQSGKYFGYVHGDQTDANGPYPELGQPFTAGGVTDGSGTLDISDIPAAGRYLVAETNSSGTRLASSDVLGLYCTGDGDTSDNNDNQELTFVPAGGVVHCVAYSLTQTITPADHTASSVYGSTFSVSATSDSGLPVDITATGGCTIDSGTVTMTSGSDSCVIHYNQAGNDAYAPATEVVETVTTSPKALTISGLTANDKVYDNTNSATLSGVATFGTPEAFGEGSSNDGLPYTGDTVNAIGGSATFAGSNVGNGIAVTVSGITSSNPNYTITQPTGITANITPLAITVTAVPNTKTYDGTTISLAAPTVSPSIISGDFGFFWQTFDNKNVGTGKTLTAHGIVLDGNSGHNYAITYVTDTTGVITARPITITADSGQGKIYGSANPALTYHITSGHVIGFHVITGSLSRAVGENVGTYAINQGTLTAGSNYAITFVGDNFTITPATAPITITAVDLNQDYNGTPRSVGVTTVPEEVSYSLTYAESPDAPTNAGTYTVVATITDPNYSGSDTQTLTIHKVNPTISVTPYDVSYDGSSHTAVGTSIGSQGEGLDGLDLSNTVHTNVGNYVEDSYSFTDSTGNYNDLESTNITDVIGLQAQTINFGELSDKLVGDADFSVSAFSSSGLPISFTADGNCSVSESTVHLTGAGTCTVTAHQEGNENIAAAEDVSQKFNINNRPSEHHSGSIVHNISGGGQVLGASTGPDSANACDEPLLTSFMKFGRKNDVEQVKKLQTFLNGYLHLTIPVTGLFGQQTLAAVKQFQIKEAEHVLKPWGITEPTGYVYKTTMWWINQIDCGGSGSEMPTL